MPASLPLLPRAAVAPLVRRPAARRLRASLGVLGLATLLAACGGGGGGGDAGAGSSGFTSGPISGFGSVIVNGIRYDDSRAEVRDDDGNRLGRGGSDDPLQLGVVVDVRGSVSDDGLRGSASSFVVRTAELKGPVTIDGAGVVRVLGTTIHITATTLFEDFAGAVAEGQVIEVHGLPAADDANALVATRIELESPDVARYTGEYRLRGRVSGLSGTAPTLSFQVGAVTVLTDAATRIDGSLVADAPVSVRLARTPDGAGAYTATRVKVKRPGFSEDRIDRVEIEGLVTAFTSLALFEVNGYPVSTASTTRFEDGSAGVRLGARVEVKGRVVAGVLQADEVELDDFDDDQRDDDDEARAPFEFKGPASALSGDASGGSFVVRGQTVAYDARTVFSDGLSASTFGGVNVEVKAVAEGGATGGSRFRAVRIERND